MLEPPQRLRGAIVRGNLAIAKRLLARFPELWLNIDPDNNGWCNLHYASYHGNYLVCFHLVSLMGNRKTCDIDLVTFDNLTVLHMPLRNHHSQTLHFLLQEFAGHQWIDRRGGALARTPLHYCCMYQFVDGLKLLLEFGADCTIQDANGDTCLHLCFAYNHMAGLEELVKFTVTRRLREQLGSGDPEDPKYESYAGSISESTRTESTITESTKAESTKTENSKTESSKSGSAIKSEAIGKSDSKNDLKKSKIRDPKNQDALRAAVNEELSRFENITNNKGWRAEDYAASFDMATRYAALKQGWIDRAVAEEWALRVPEIGNDDMYASSYVHTMLMNSLASSNLAASSGSLVDPVLLSPMHLIQPLLLRHGSLMGNPEDPGLGIVGGAGADIGLGNTAGTSSGNGAPTARQHSRSLPGAVPDERPVPPRKRSQSIVFRPLRTPTLGGNAMPPPLTPIELSRLELSKTPSLKSVTILPLVRYARRSSDDVSDPKLQAQSTPTASVSSSSTAGSPAVTPNSARSAHSVSMSPLQYVRQRSASTSNSKDFPIAAARAATDAAARSRPIKPGKTLPLLKSSNSTPILQMLFLDSLWRKRSNAHLSSLAMVESLSNGSTDTIDLAALGESGASHRFVVPVESEKLKRSPLPDVGRSPSQVTPLNFLPLGKQEKDKSSIREVRPERGVSEPEKPTRKPLVRNVSSISFTSVRDE